MAMGQAAPTLAEQATFSTPGLHLPKSLHEASLMMKGCSLILDVVLGTQHPLTTTYRTFLRTKWQQVEATLHAPLSTTPDAALTLLPCILCWVQGMLAEYLYDLMAGLAIPPIPDFDELGRIITRRQYHALPALPDR